MRVCADFYDVKEPIVSCLPFSNIFQKISGWTACVQLPPLQLTAKNGITNLKMRELNETLRSERGSATRSNVTCQPNPRQVTGALSGTPGFHPRSSIFSGRLRACRAKAQRRRVSALQFVRIIHFVEDFFAICPAFFAHPAFKSTGLQFCLAAFNEDRPCKYHASPKKSYPPISPQLPLKIGKNL